MKQFWACRQVSFPAPFLLQLPFSQFRIQKCFYLCSPIHLYNVKTVWSTKTCQCLLRFMLLFSLLSVYSFFILFSWFSSSLGNLWLPAAPLIWMMKLYSFVWISVYIIHSPHAVKISSLFEVFSMCWKIKWPPEKCTWGFVTVFNSPLWRLRHMVHCAALNYPRQVWTLNLLLLKAFRGQTKCSSSVE